MAITAHSSPMSIANHSSATDQSSGDQSGGEVTGSSACGADESDAIEAVSLADNEDDFYGPVASLLMLGPRGVVENKRQLLCLVCVKIKTKEVFYFVEEVEGLFRRANIEEMYFDGESVRICII